MKTRPFIDTLRDVEFGALLDELSDVQKEVVAAVSDTRKAGKITIELEYKSEGDGQLAIKTNIKKKVPTYPRGTSIFFITPERNLTRQDPRQQSLPLRNVETAPATQLKDISNG